MERGRQWHTDKRKFKKYWEQQYFFTEIDSTAVCLICSQRVAVVKEYNLRRHYETRHSHHTDKMEEGGLFNLQVCILYMLHNFFNFLSKTWLNLKKVFKYWAMLNLHVSVFLRRKKKVMFYQPEVEKPASRGRSFPGFFWRQQALPFSPSL